jgi:acetylornithine deacetylase
MAGEFIAMLGRLGEELAADADGHFDPPHTTVQANMIAGGTAVNVLAREARITWEYRALPDRDGPSIVKAAESRAAAQILPRYRAGAPDAAFATRIRAAYPGLIRDPQSRAVALAAQITGDNEIRAVSYGTEAGLFQAAGIPAVVCGPGSIEQAHKADEFVALDQLEACAVFLSRVAAKAAE